MNAPQKTKTYVLALLAFLLAPFFSYASHDVAVDFTYRWISGDTYEFQVKFYRDCSGATAPASIIVSFTSPSGCGSTFFTTLDVDGPGVEVSPLCPADLSNSSCRSGTLPGVEEYIYTEQVTLPAQCSDWIASIRTCCRNASITNLSLVGGAGQYVELKLNNTNNLHNSSPVFSSLPVPYICVGRPYCFTQGATDPDGDSLAFYLINPLSDANNPIIYNFPYSQALPMSDSTTITFDSTNGTFCVTADQIQAAVITILVEEYRNGNLIGSVMRDLQIISRPCGNQQPFLSSGGMINVSGGFVQDSNSIQICPGNSLSYDLIFTDPDVGDSLVLTTDIATAIPGATLTTAGTNPSIAQFSWTPTVADLGVNSFSITVSDTNCPFPGYATYTFDITVIGATNAGPDQAYCLTGAPVNLVANGGSVFTWSVLSGDFSSLTCNPCQVQSVSPSVTTTYEVSSNFSGGCVALDTVTVTTVPNFPLSLTPATAVVCRNGVVQLNANAGPSGGPFTYSWTPSVGLNSSSSPTPLATPTATTKYYCEVASALGCTKVDSITVTYGGIGPSVTASPTDTSICQGESVPLQATAALIPVACAPNPAGCSGPTQVATVGTGTSGFSFLGPFHGSSGAQFNMRRQYIVTAAELQAQGITRGGTITEIGFDLMFAKPISFDNFRIRIACDTVDTYTFQLFRQNVSEVYFRANHVLPNAAGWHTITLDTPYDWDGLSSLIIDICSNGSPDLDFNTVRHTSTLPDFRTLYDNAALFNSCIEFDGIRTSNRPNMQFTVCYPDIPSPVYLWTPAAGLDDPAVLSPVATPAATTTYIFEAQDLISGCSDTTTVQINVGPNYTLNTLPDTTICFGSSVDLFATPSMPGSYNYVWTPGTDLSSTTDSVPTATPQTIQDYITVIDNGGCIKSDTITVSLSGTPVIAAADLDTVCPGTSVQLDVQLLNPFEDSFDPEVDSTVWDTLIGATPNSDCAANTGTNALHFDGNTATREAVTTRLNTTGCTTLNFCLIFGSGGAPCEDPEAGEDVEVNYSIDGGNTWIQLALYDEALFTSWTCFNEPLPLAAQSPSTQFQWRQISFTPGVGSDNWALDDVSTSCGPFSYAWTPGGGVSNPAIQNPDATVDATNNSFAVTVTNLSNPTCPVLTNIVIPLDSSVSVAATSLDPSYCGGDSITLDATAMGTPIPSSIASCGINGTSLTQPPVTTQLGSDVTATFLISPFQGLNRDNKVQWLVRASELTSAGISSGTITELAFNMAFGLSPNPYENVTMSLACTGATELTPGVWEAENTVFGPAQVDPTVGWNTFSISPFDWDGTSNLVITVCHNNPDGASPGGHDYAEYSPTGFTSQLNAPSNNAGVDGCAIAAPTQDYPFRPNIRFTVVPPAPAIFTYSWNPVDALNDPTSPTPRLLYTVDTFYTVTVNGGRCPVEDTVFLTGCILDAESLLLTGRREGEAVDLSWVTQRERNTDYFKVQRSTDGIQYTTLTTVQAAGDASGEIRYADLDDSPHPGVNHYRIVLVDREGNFQRSNTVTFHFTNGLNVLSIYPNPVGEQERLNLDFFAQEPGPLSLTLHDLWGRPVKQESWQVESGTNSTQWDLGKLANGSYTLKVLNGSRIWTRKVVLVR